MRFLKRLVLAPFKTVRSTLKFLNYGFGAREPGTAEEKSYHNTGIIATAIGGVIVVSAIVGRILLS